MDQVPLNQTYIEPQPVPGVVVEEQVPASSRKVWVFVAILAVVVLGLLGAVIWRLEQRRNEVLQSSVSVQPTADQPATNQQAVASSEIKISEAFMFNDTKALESIPTWQNPFFSDPCFVKGDKTCQFVFNQPTSSSVNIYSLVLPKRQERQDVFFLFGRMLVIRGPVYESYLQTLRTGIEPQPYQDFLKNIHQSGLKNNINPAFLFALYNEIYKAADDLGFEVNEIVTIFPPQKMAQEIAAYLSDDALVNNKRDLRVSLELKDWSQEAKAVAYTLSANMNYLIAEEIFSTEHRLEQEYYKLFSPTELKGTVNLSFTENPLSVATVFPDDKNQISPYDYALCRNNMAYFCDQNGLSATCSSFAFYDYTCRELTNIP